ncbi:MAG: aminoacetone oxidase family FAD-binding enzyme [Oscillospiraceae bacterium]|nr:aminoacetone oxidase family FAD-binding enzyme [Oscillospiraceae bacterium]
MKVAVVGAGAAGMLASISAREAGAEVVALEQHARVGKKLLATGNGRCNVMNAGAVDGRYNGDGAGVAASMVGSAGARRLISYFEGIGLLLREEGERRVYPASGTANAVVDALRFRMDRVGVSVLCGWAVGSIRRERAGFTLNSLGGESIRADRVIVATGGRAGIAGTDALGYELLARLGHPITSPRPALAPIRVAADSIRGLKGVRALASLALMDGERQIRAESGEIIFSDNSISGIPIMQCSRYISGGANWLRIDLLPEREAGAWRAWLEARAADDGHANAEALLRGLVHPRVALCLLRAAGAGADVRAADAPWRAIARLLRDWRIPVLGTADFSRAQVTAGGASLSAFNPDTLESKLIPGLFAAGEALDVDGDCGGFNLMWAWASGITVGTHIAKQ